MFQLGRAHVRGLGPPDARIDPVTLDFCDADGSPRHTVLWLANGGGKTTLLRLLFHVVRFGEARTIGKADARAQAALGGALGRDDVGHVMLEWRWTGPPRTLAGGDERLLTGLVCSWRRGRAGGGTGDIARHWYSLTATDGHPFDELTCAQVSDGHRTPHERYVDALRRRGRERPQEAVVLLDGLAKWEEHLGRVGLDSELFGTQVRMNHGEGGADEMLANIRSPGDLVAFLLRAITPSEALEGVDAQLDGYATKLAERPTLERESIFVDELRETLERLRVRNDQHRAAGEAYDAARRAARELGAATRAAAQRYRAEADALGARRSRWQDEASGHDNRRRDASRRAAGLELWLARDAARVAREVVQSTATAAAASRLDAEAWRAVPSLASFAAAQDRTLALREQLDAADAATRPWRQAAQAALRTLVARLDALLSDDDHELDGLAARRLAHQSEVAAHERRREETQQGLEKAVGELATTDAALGTIDGELTTARADGVLDAGEEPTAACQRHEATASEADRRLVDARTRRATARVAADDAAGAAEDARREIEATTTEHDGRIAEREVLDRERAELTREERLLQVLEATTIDLDLAGSDAVTALSAAMDRQERRRTAVVAGGAADERRLAHVTATGLLPVSDDVTAVIEAYRSQGLDVATGAEHLKSGHGETERARRLARDPGFADTVVITGGFRPDVGGGAPMRAVPLRDADENIELPAVQGHQGTWDASEAAAWAADAGGRSDERNRLADALRSQIEDDRRLAARLTAHVGRWDADARSKAAAAIAELERDIAARTTDLDAARQRGEEARSGEERARDDERAAQRASAAAHASRHTAARLVDRVAPATELRDKRSTLATTVQQLREAQEAAVRGARSERERDLELEGESVRMRTRRDRRAALRDQYAPRLDVADSTSDEQPPQADPITDVDVLIARLEAADQEVLRRSPADEVRSALAEAERTARDARAQLPPDPGVHARADELLHGSAGADHDGRRRATADAGIRAEADAVAAGRAHDALTAADKAVDGLVDAADAVTPDPAPENPEVGRVALAATRREQEAATVAGRDAETLLRETADAHGQLAMTVQRLSDAAEGFPDPDPDDPRPDPALVERLGDLSAVLEERGAAQAAIDEAKERSDAAVARRDEAALKVQDVLVDARHEGLADAIRRDLRDLGSVRLVARAAPLVEELQRRAEMIADRLATLAQDRTVVATTLAREVDGAVRALRRIQRRSALPDGLGSWSGRPMVTFGGLDLPREPTEIAALVGGVIERLVTADQRPRGVDLLVRAVLDALDQSRLTARILKPTGGDPGEPQPVDQLPTFSGGQRATVAILLYATFARVRRDGLMQRGQDAGVGTLFLDNPLGKANAQFLVDRQLAVAQAAGIQLVYTTGIGDFDALDRFPVVIRLRNRGVVGRAMRRVLPEEDARAVVLGGGDGLEAAHQQRRGT